MVPVNVTIKLDFLNLKFPPTGHFQRESWQHRHQRVSGDYYGSAGPQTVPERRMQLTGELCLQSPMETRFDFFAGHR